MRLSGGLSGNQISSEQGTTTGRMKEGFVLGILALFQNPDSFALKGWHFQRTLEEQHIPVSPKCYVWNREAAALLHSQSSEWRVTDYSMTTDLSSKQATRLPAVIKLNLYTQATGGPACHMRMSPCYRHRKQNCHIAPFF